MVVTPADYCREIEAYLTRKNDGHLIRIVGPAFDRVCAWAEQGVPLKVAFQGIDTYVERYYAKGPRRRPVRIDHCEADVLEGFDRWRRAVGVGMASEESGDAAARRHEGLATSLTRAVARLTALRGGNASAPLAAALEAAVRELDQLATTARTARGGAREAVVTSLQRIDKDLLAAVRATLPDDVLSGLRRQAADDLAPFRQRMAPEAWTNAVDAALDRAIRDRAGLPLLRAE